MIFEAIPVDDGSVYITKCQALLPNGMQCVKAGAFTMTEGPQVGAQFCRQHTQMLNAGLNTDGTQINEEVIPLTPNTPLQSAEEAAASEGKLDNVNNLNTTEPDANPSKRSV